MARLTCPAPLADFWSFCATLDTHGLGAVHLYFMKAVGLSHSGQNECLLIVPFDFASTFFGRLLAKTLSVTLVF